MVKRPEALYEKYDAVAQTDGLPEVPKDVRENLAYELRPYQEEALGRWYRYMDVDMENRKLPAELLFNMATGSGKTLMMAALILDLYKRGYRNFVYFVNSTNIIEKTKDNFSNQASNKYLFAEKILIDGERVDINVVNSLTEGVEGAINIMFATIQGLHTDLNTPRENRVNYGDFEGQKVVLIGDEAHHNNTKTMMSKEDLADNRSWEATVERIMSVAKEPVLLEFTATIDLDDSNIYKKYCERIIYKYDLKRFRADGYSKDVLIYHVDADSCTRMLQAMIISQYRKKVALRHGIWLKPVVMFKSRTIAENKQNFEQFNDLVRNLSAEQVKAQQEGATSVLAEAFKGMGLTPEDLAEELKNDFGQERLILIDGKHIANDKQLKLNSLEDDDNEYRAVFAVDMLNEGWDVLNLFDIVRLYDTRDARDNKPGRTTLREAQLIGRGARYFPFVTDNVEKKYVRKFDNNENEALRILEQLHYHSAHNPKYIQELRQALISSGILEEDYIERTLHLKSGFINSRIYKKGVIYVNKRETLTQRMARLGGAGGEWSFEGQRMEIQLPTGLAGLVGVFGGVPKNEPLAVRENLETIVKALIPENVLRYAMERNKNFRFENLRKRMVGVRSAQEFREKLGALELLVNGVGVMQGELSAEQQLYIAEEVLRMVETQFETNEVTYVGTEEFVPLAMAEVFPSEVRRKYYLKAGETDQEWGAPQSVAKNPAYRLNLAECKWYAYDENYGTSEEKSLVKTLDGMMRELSKKWAEIYLVRNERMFTLYDFAEGRGFEPSFVLVAQDKREGVKSWQIFIEAKSGPLLSADKWKEDFLLEIGRKKAVEVLAEDEKVRILGLPVYNEGAMKEEVVEEMRGL